MYVICIYFIFSQGVESERCASFTAALEAGKPVYTKAHSTLADGLYSPVFTTNYCLHLLNYMNICIGNIFNEFDFMKFYGYLIWHL